MGSAMILGLIQAGIALVQAALPEFRKLAASGEIPIETQEQVKNSLDALRSDAAFKGKEWEVDGSAG